MVCGLRQFVAIGSYQHASTDITDLWVLPRCDRQITQARGGHRRTLTEHYRRELLACWLAMLRSRVENRKRLSSFEAFPGLRNCGRCSISYNHVAWSCMQLNPPIQRTANNHLFQPGCPQCLSVPIHALSMQARVKDANPCLSILAPPCKNSSDLSLL